VDSYLMSREVTRKLFDTIAPWYTERNGGYTRVLKTRARLGDGGEMALLELVKSEKQMETDRRRREEAAAAKAAEAEEKAKPKLRP
jgi:large subunit ribosomal protein L17